MKIVHVAASYAPNRGGVETHLKEVAALQVQEGHQVTVICQQHATEKLIETLDSVQVLRIPYLFKNKKLPTWKWMCSNLQLFTQADVVQVHDVFWMLLPFHFFIALHAKIITTFHGWEGKYPIALSAKVLRYIYSVLSYKTVHVGEYIQEFYWDKPDAVVYGGSPTISTDQKKGRKKTISFIGRLVAENCIQIYIHLFSLLKQKDPAITVQWIGDGPYRTECEAVGEVTGMVDSPLSHTKAAELICANSYLSIIEAQTAGKKVCAMYKTPLKQRYLETYPASDQLILDSNPHRMAEKVAEYLKTHTPRRKASLPKQLSWKHVAAEYARLWNT